MRRIRNCCAWTRNGGRLEETAGSKEKREIAGGNGTGTERKRERDRGRRRERSERRSEMHARKEMQDEEDERSATRIG